MHMDASIDNHQSASSIEDMGEQTGRFWITSAISATITKMSFIPHVILGIATHQYNFDKTFGGTGNNSLPRPRLEESVFWDWPIYLEYDSAINLLSDLFQDACVHLPV